MLISHVTAKLQKKMGNNIQKGDDFTVIFLREEPPNTGFLIERGY